MRDPGNRLGQAKNIGALSGFRRFRDALSPRDRQDFYRFALNSSNTLSISLTNLRADANLTLLNERGRRIAISQKRGRANESIQTNLERGTYYLQVIYKSGRTSYQLSLQATSTTTPTPTPPTNNVPVGTTPIFFNLSVNGTTFTGNTAFPASNTVYTPFANFSLPGSLSIESTYFAQNAGSNGTNLRDIGLFIGNDASLATAGTVRYGTHTLVHRFWGGSTTRPPVDTAFVNVNGGTGAVTVNVDPTWARNDTTNLFVWRSSIFNQPTQVLAGTVELQFTNGGLNVSGTAIFYGGGFIESGSYAYAATFTGVRV